MKTKRFLSRNSIIIVALTLITSHNGFAKFDEDVHLPNHRKVSTVRLIGKGTYKNILSTVSTGVAVYCVQNDSKDVNLRSYFHEAKIQRYLSGKISGVLPVLGKNFDHNHTCFYVEFYSGYLDVVNYLELIDSGFTLIDHINFASQTCATIVDMHKEDIVHRDIKRENIIVKPAEGGKRGYEKYLLTDFGFAFLWQSRFMRHRDSDNLSLGTFPSPEYRDMVNDMEKNKTMLFTETMSTLDTLKKNDLWAFGITQMMNIKKIYDSINEMRDSHYQRNNANIDELIEQQIRSILNPDDMDKTLSDEAKKHLAQLIKAAMGTTKTNFEEACSTLNKFSKTPLSQKTLLRSGETTLDF